MTDLLGDLETEADLPPLDGPPADFFAPVRCANPDCDVWIDAGKGGFKRKYCDDHRPKPHTKKGGTKRDSRPRSVTVNVGAPLKPTKGEDAEIAALRKRALTLANSLAGALALFGGERGQLDAADILANSDQLAAALAELAKHEAWLRKLAAGGEASDRALAWFGVISVAIAIALPILIRHDIVKGKLAQAATTFGLTGNSMGDLLGEFRKESADQAAWERENQGSDAPAA